jgi:hypothetical protein
MTGIDPNLKPVKQGEWTLDMEHELAPTMSFGVRYVHKWLFRTIEDVGIFYQGSEIYLISNPGEGLAVQMEPSVPDMITPKPVRKYDGIEFRLNRRFANNWSGTVSYLYSRLWGNYSGLASSDENGRTSPNVNRYYDNTVMSYDANGNPVYGPLQTDRPHIFKLQAAFELFPDDHAGAVDPPRQPQCGQSAGLLALRRGRRLRSPAAHRRLHRYDAGRIRSTRRRTCSSRAARFGCRRAFCSEPSSFEIRPAGP